MAALGGRFSRSVSLVSSPAFGFAKRVPYRVAPIFLIRLAGAPFQCIEELATPRTCTLARDLLVRVNEITAGDRAQRGVVLERELPSARAVLWKSGRNLLAPYLVFAVGGVRELLSHLLAPPVAEEQRWTRRNSRAGDRERHLLLYLQRIAAKNDTFSEFGPTGWGEINNEAGGSRATSTGKPEKDDEPGGESSNHIWGMELAPRPGVAMREAFLERWTAHAIAAGLHPPPRNLGRPL